jgi:sugar-specific transcriptional regulator TrmB
METAILRRIGLTEYETKSYIALLTYGSMPGRAVADKSGVPPTRVFDALKSLSDKGFVSITSEKPMMFQAIEPEIAVKGFLNERISSLQNIEKTVIESLKNIKKPLTTEEIKEKVIVTHGFDNMFKIGNDMFEKAKKEVLIFSSGEEIPYSHKIAWKKATNRGIKTRFIAQKFDKENVHILKEFKELGAAIRHYPSKDYSIAIQDKERVCIIVKNPSDPKDRIITLFDSKDLARSLADWFEVIWNKAKLVKF